MTVKQMHIMFGVGFQKLNANPRRKIFAAELDVLLNQQVDRFINDHVRPKPEGLGFEVDQDKVDALRALIVTDYSLFPVLSKDTKFARVYKAELPINYRNLLNENVGLSCTIPDTTPKDLRYSVFKIPDTTKSTTPFYVTASIAVGSTTIANIGTLPGWIGQPSKPDKFVLTSLVPEIFLENKQKGLIDGYALYWERYQGLYFPNSFILIYDGTTTVTNVTVTVDGTATNFPFTTLTVNTTPGTTDYETNARPIKANQIDTIMTMPFYKPTRTSPVAVLVDNRLALYVHTSTIVSSLQISYVREPEKIDLALSRNCQLPPNYHEKIVSDAVEFAAGTTGQADLYQFKSRDNAPV